MPRSRPPRPPASASPVLPPDRYQSRPATGNTSAARKIKGAFSKSATRLKAAQFMLGGPVTFNGMLAAKIGNREALMKAVIAPWFTMTDNGRYKLTEQGRDEDVEAMDGPGDGPDDEPETGPAGPAERQAGG